MPRCGEVSADFVHSGCPCLCAHPSRMCFFGEPACRRIGVKAGMDAIGRGPVAYWWSIPLMVYIRIPICRTRASAPVSPSWPSTSGKTRADCLLYARFKTTATIYILHALQMEAAVAAEGPCFL